MSEDAAPDVVLEGPLPDPNHLLLEVRIDLGTGELKLRADDETTLMTVLNGLSDAGVQVWTKLNDEANRSGVALIQTLGFLVQQAERKAMFRHAVEQLHSEGVSEPLIVSAGKGN